MIGKICLLLQLHSSLKQTGVTNIKVFSGILSENHQISFKLEYGVVKIMSAFGVPLFCCCSILGTLHGHVLTVYLVAIRRTRFAEALVVCHGFPHGTSAV